MERRVFVWSVPDQGGRGMIEKRIRYMLKHKWAGEGWSEINIKAIKDVKEFKKKMEEIYGVDVKINKDGLVNKTTGEGQLWGYLREDTRIKPGDIIILKSGSTPYAIGIAESGCEYREDAKDLDIANGIRVKWIIHNNGEPISFPENLHRFRGIIRWLDDKRVVDAANKAIQEVLNAQKFRGDS